MSLNETVSAERIHIGFFGMRNAGKSSLVNAITGVNVSVVSDVKGTTTDPVRKAMELLPLGPVLIIDTPGIDDEGEIRQLLTALEKGEASDAVALIPEHASEVYYILSYLSPEQAKGVFAAQNKCVFQEFKVCLRDVGAFIPEDKRDEYRLSLDAFKTLLYENGVSFFTVTEGGEKNEE